MGVAFETFDISDAGVWRFCLVCDVRGVSVGAMHPPEIPILGPLSAGKTQRHLVRLPGEALANDEPRPVITVTGAKPGPVLFVSAGVHGGEDPGIEPGI